MPHRVPVQGPLLVLPASPEHRAGPRELCPDPTASQAPRDPWERRVRLRGGKAASRPARLTGGSGPETAPNASSLKASGNKRASPLGNHADGRPAPENPLRRSRCVLPASAERPASDPQSRTICLFWETLSPSRGLSRKSIPTFRQWLLKANGFDFVLKSGWSFRAQEGTSLCEGQRLSTASCGNLL